MAQKSVELFPVRKRLVRPISGEFCWNRFASQVPNALSRYCGLQTEHRAARSPVVGAQVVLAQVGFPGLLQERKLT